MAKKFSPGPNKGVHNVLNKGRQRGKAQVPKGTPKGAVLSGRSSVGPAKAPTPALGPGISRPPVASKPRKRTKPHKRSNRPIARRKLAKAGLPVPTQLDRTSASFIALQKHWYDKAAATKSTEYPDGFKDIEWTEAVPNAQNSDFLKYGAALGRVWSPDRAQFYRLLQNYLTHAKPRGRDGTMLQMFNDGHAYRPILKALKKRGLRKSLYWLYYRLQKLIKVMYEWNATAAEGMLNPANQDSWADDALLRDLQGTEGYIEAPNGLKLDIAAGLDVKHSTIKRWRNGG